MPQLQKKIMTTLYGRDIWDGFIPDAADGQVHGWNGDHPALRRLAELTTERVVVDVGVWKGQSTITLAGAMAEAALDGCVIAVDTFLGAPEHWPLGNAPDSSDAAAPSLYRTFLSNVHHAGLHEYVVPLPQTSIGAARILKRFGIRAALVHIDAAHEYEEVLRDIEEFWKILALGGYLIGDDYDQTWPGVVRAAGEFSARMSVPLTVEAPKWVLRRTSIAAARGNDPQPASAAGPDGAEDLRTIMREMVADVVRLRDEVVQLKGTVAPNLVWQQDVVNQLAARLAALEQAQQRRRFRHRHPIKWLTEALKSAAP